MREVPEFTEVMAAWRDQPEEEVPVEMERIHRQRTWELFSTTRSEILGSIVAALFFASVMAWRFGPERERLVLWGCAGVVVWAAVTVLRYRSFLRAKPIGPDELAIAGLEHYRAELLRRRDHLRSAWVWHGPLLLACILTAATLARRVVPGRLWEALPVVLLLAGWAVIGIRRRLRQVADLQTEIDEIRKESTQ
ncbi:MAG: hypothetical protein HY820_13620 [Acidobacteria bacterium]|nr:hypothetical protein [Acidobacteriota bacterium]